MVIRTISIVISNEYLHRSSGGGRTPRRGASTEPSPIRRRARRGDGAWLLEVADASAIGASASEVEARRARRRWQVRSVVRLRAGSINRERAPSPPAEPAGPLPLDSLRSSIVVERLRLDRRPGRSRSRAMRTRRAHGVGAASVGAADVGAAGVGAAIVGVDRRVKS